MSSESLKVKPSLQTEDSIIAKHISTPSNPPNGYNKIYPKSDGKFYNLQSDGTESELGGGAEPDPIFISDGTASINNNQVSPANVTGLIIDSTQFRSFSLEYYVNRMNALTGLSESGRLKAVYNSLDNTWYATQTNVAGDADIIFDITPSGQVTYTTSNMSPLGYFGQMKFDFITKIEI